MKLRFPILSLVFFAAVACGGGNSSLNGGDAGSGSNDGDDDGSSSSGDHDGGTSSSGGKDGGKSDGGTSADGGATTSDPDAVIDLTFSGCSPDFEDVRVATNVVSYDSIAVSSAYSPLNGGVQIALKNSAPATFTLSTDERSQNGNDIVLNLYAGGTTYTNLCYSGTGGCSYDASSSSWQNDPIAGTLKVTTYDPQNGKLDVTFTGVVVQQVTSTQTCTVNGHLVTKRLSQ
ncbi:MAG TPA: hypothetical protein VF407_06575 [Polyangiaceae bacterium]